MKTEVEINGTRVCAIARGAGGVCTLKINGSGQGPEGSPRFYAHIGDEVTHVRAMAHWIAFSLSVSGKAFLDFAQAYAGGYADAVMGGVLKPFLREEYFVAWKIHATSLTRKEDFYDSIKNGLNSLGIQYFDLLLTHQSPPNMEEYLPWLEEARKSGYTQSIGLGQVKSQELQSALDMHFKIHAIQNSASPHVSYVDATLAALCEKNNIAIMAYRPYGGVMGDPVAVDRIKPIADARGITVAQATIAWARTKGFIPITGTMQDSHMRENLDALRIELTLEEIGIMSS